MVLQEYKVGEPAANEKGLIGGKRGEVGLGCFKVVTEGFSGRKILLEINNLDLRAFAQHTRCAHPWSLPIPFEGLPRRFSSTFQTSSELCLGPPSELPKVLVLETQLPSRLLGQSMMILDVAAAGLGIAM